MALESKKRRRGSGDERRMGHRRNRRHALQQGQITRAGAEGIIGDDRRIRLAAELAVFSGVHMVVQARADGFGGILEVGLKIITGNVQHADAGVLTRVGA